MANHRKHHTCRHLMRNETVMAYLKRVSHYETTQNIRDHIFEITGWDVDYDVVVKLQGGNIKKNGGKGDSGVIAQRVLWDKITVLSKRGMKREDIIVALGITKHLMTRLERLHRCKIQ